MMHNRIRAKDCARAARRSVSLVAIVAALGLAACGDAGDSGEPAASAEAPAPAEAPAASFAAVDDMRLATETANPGEWAGTGKTYEEQRFSPLDQINTEIVSQLGLAWFADLDTNQNQEATPVMVDGVLYVSTAWSKVYALDAKTGEQLWKYDPKVPGQWQQNACCGVVNRGVAAWNGKIYVGTIDGRLVALDAKTGEEVWVTPTFDPENLPANRYAITGAPRVVKGKVIMGAGGAEFGVRGFVAAYDSETGEREWIFYTVPGNPADGFENEAMEMAAETWNGEWWKYGGGGTVWDGMAYDPENDLLYVGSGNGSPWNQSIRSPGGGDNLFLASIIALDPDTGEYVWHYQTTPGETWDYTATAPLMVATLNIGGQDRRVVMQAPKNGYFHVLDAATGEFISANNIVPVNWAMGHDEGGRPIPNPEARFDQTGEVFWLTPGPAGGHSWHPISYNPETGLVYLEARYSAMAFKNPETFEFSPVGTNSGVVHNGPDFPEMPEEYEFPQRGSLLAWDPVANEKVWEHPFEGEGRYGGTLSTAGNLVFQGNGENEFAAYNAETGEQLWDFDPQTGVTAGPISYEIDGEQYVAVVPGRAANDYYAPNYSRVLVFKLGGTVMLPEPAEFTPAPFSTAEQFAEADVIEHGAGLFEQNCAICHGDSGATRSTFPDLRRSVRLGSQPAFDSVVLEGALAENGMASFAAGLTPEDTTAVRAYLISTAQEAIARESEGPGAGADSDAPAPGAPQSAADDPDADDAAADAGSAHAE